MKFSFCDKSKSHDKKDRQTIWFHYTLSYNFVEQGYKETKMQLIFCKDTVKRLEEALDSPWAMSY